MRLSPLQRWVILGAALALTLVAVRWAASDDDIEVKSPRLPGAAVKPPHEALPRLELDRLNRLAHAAPAADPFAPRSWQAMDQVERRTNAPPPPPPPRPQAPKLPFTYFGQAIEDGQTTVFLLRGENSYVARAGSKLDDSYRVDRIDDRVIVFTYLPLGTRQELPLGPAK
ncbi:MAG: hypothetical protein WCE38_19665 [Burkholderiales bacterium]